MIKYILTLAVILISSTVCINAQTQTVRGNLKVTGNIGGTSLTISGTTNTIVISNVVITGWARIEGTQTNNTIIAQTFESPTNSWAVNTPIGLGTNANYVSSTATLGITGVANLPTSTIRAGQLIIKASGGNVTFTNLDAIRMNDHLTSRLITNGYSAVINVLVTPGFSTNGFFIHQ